MMHTVLKTILEISIYSSAMIIAVLAIGKLFFGKISAKIIHMLWLLVLVRLLLPITIEIPVDVPYPNFAKPFESGTHDKPSPPAENDVFFANTAGAEKISLAPAEITGAAKTSGAPDAQFEIKPFILVFWLIGAASILIINLCKAAVYKRKVRNIKTTNYLCGTRLELAKNALGIKKYIRIAESKYADIPLVFGIFRPIILFPEGFTGVISGKKLSYIILHELCHIKRHDLIINLIWLLARAIHWFNPLVHIAYKSYLNIIEEACDEAVAGRLGNSEKCDYIQSLLDAARHAKSNKKPLISVALSKETTALRKRIMKMIRPKKKSKAALLAAILSSCVMVFACFTTACMPDEADPAPVKGEAPKEAITEMHSREKRPLTSASIVAAEPEEIITKMDAPEMKTYIMFHTENYYGDYLCYFMPKDTQMDSIGPTSYVFLRSDKSLLGYYSHKTDLSMPLQFTETEFREKALQYIKKIWGYEYIETISSQVSEDSTPSREEYFYEFTGKSSSDERRVYINLDGNGDLNVVNSYPKMDLSKGVTMDEAYEIALSEIKRDAHIIDESNLKIINKSIKNDNKLYPVYYFNIHYSAQNPTAEEFDYSCQININSSNGKCNTIAVRPYVYNNPELILPDDAAILAKKHIAETYYGSKELWSNLRQAMLHINTFEGEVEYYFDFDYYPEGGASREIERSYGISMSATGEIWDINAYSPSDE